MGVVHVISATLRPDAPPEAVSAALDHAQGLREADGARHVVVGRTGERLVTVTWVEGREALEAFAASPAHMAFIMRGLAPCIRSMWSAAVESEAAPPAHVDAVWAFALRASDGMFEWQVRDLLRDIDAMPGTLAAGATIEERERYRAGGAVCLETADVEAFRGALDGLRARWPDLAGVLDEALVEVAPR